MYGSVKVTKDQDTFLLTVQNDKDHLIIEDVLEWFRSPYEKDKSEYKHKAFCDGERVERVEIFFMATTNEVARMFMSHSRYPGCMENASVAVNRYMYTLKHLQNANNKSSNKTTPRRNKPQLG